jgi:uncharacterized protein YndB with AHSA1/START domain
MSRPFEVRREIDLPAAPEDVWTAITARPAAWMFPTGMEIPAGGAPPEGAPITTWDPPHRLVVRMESPDGTFNALDYAIEARDGGTAHLRYVHSGILADGWEDQYDAIGGHTHAMDALRAALGVSSNGAVGDAVHASLGDAGTLDGVVDYATPEFLGVRTADGLYRFFGRNHYGSVVGLSAHLFADGVDAAAQEAALKAWLDAVYA